MKILVPGFILLFFHLQITAQMPSPVSWSFSSDHITGKEYELHFTADIEGDWHIYSQFIDDGGPVPTSFQYEETDHFTKLGKTEEKGDRKEGFDALFEMNVIKFSKAVDFVQRIKVNDSNKMIRGQVEFMVCNEESCLPPKKVDFSIPLK